MPYFVDIKCPTNGQPLAFFLLWDNRYYLLSNRAEFHMQTSFGWCHACEEFVEIEKIPGPEEIQAEIDKIESYRAEWEQEDLRANDWFRITRQRSIPESIRNEVRHRNLCEWRAWRQTRKTPPRCLVCGSFFAVVPIPMQGSFPHPGGKGIAAWGYGGHCTGPAWPDYEYFDADGKHFATVPHELGMMTFQYPVDWPAPNFPRQS